jgi:hypothetical protein
MKFKTIFILALLALLALALSACGIAGISREGNRLTVDVNMSEAQVNNLIGLVVRRGNSVTSDFLLDQITSVDLIEPDTIRVNGTADGVAGNYDATINAADGTLRIVVVDVDIPGISLDDPRIEEANRELTEAFVNSASAENDGRFTSAAVSDDQLTITIEVDLGR